MLEKSPSAYPPYTQTLHFEGPEHHFDTLYNLNSWQVHGEQELEQAGLTVTYENLINTEENPPTYAILITIEPNPFEGVEAKLDLPHFERVLKWARDTSHAHTSPVPGIHPS